MTATLTSSRPEPAAAHQAADTDTETDLGHLKRLLLVDERRELQALRADVRRLDRRAGSDDRFCRAVADSLVVALKVVEVESHRDLAAVMAPLVISGIRREIAESRDMMVETLYPITGRMVAAGIGAMFKQLSEDINRKLEAVISPKQFQLRLKALITRRPLSELVLAEAGQGRLERLILIERSTGAVLAATGAEGTLEAEPDNALNLVGGLVSAIVEFAGHALSDMQGELRQLDFGGQRVLLRASPVYIVAAITAAGAVSSRLPTVLDHDFLAFLDRLHAAEAPAPGDALAALHRSLAGHMAPTGARKARLSPLTVVAALLAAGAMYAAINGLLSARERARQETTLAQLERSPALAGYPVSLALDRQAGIVRATGVVSTPAVLTALKGEIAKAFPGWPVEARMAVLSETPQAKAAEERLRDLQSRAASLESAAKTAQAAVADARAAAVADGRAVRRMDERVSAVIGEQGVAFRRLTAIEQEQRRSHDRVQADLADARARFVTLGAGIDGLTAEMRTRATMRDLDTMWGTVDAIGARLPAVETGQTALAGRIDSLAHAASGDRRAIASGLLDTKARLDGIASEVATLAAVTAERQSRDGAAVRGEIAALGERTDTAARRLDEAVRETAVFFGNAASYRDADRTLRDLKALAAALSASKGSRLRVVGYSDGIGTPKGNIDAARARAEHVATDLRALGVDPARLVLVTTRQPYPIADDPAAVANRRVIFERVYTGE